MEGKLFNAFFIPSAVIFWSLFMMENIGEYILRWQLGNSSVFSYFEAMKITGLVSWGGDVSAVFFTMSCVLFGLLATYLYLMVVRSVIFLCEKILLLINNFYKKVRSD
ncbi:hypothetical protein [Pectobacterium brasiliense]|uniref:hypothetical protein n=1 Tax=Pectobacterium brasiliense TaxID=180957 RepID=UPI0019694F7A|nr:hypothetical protein [Pectobacterium brasiliense]MBN3262943.1 hypothetical protein [Pectobacterium brasiliense]